MVHSIGIDAPDTISTESYRFVVAIAAFLALIGSTFNWTQIPVDVVPVIVTGMFTTLDPVVGTVMISAPFTVDCV